MSQILGYDFYKNKYKRTLFVCHVKCLQGYALLYLVCYCKFVSLRLTTKKDIEGGRVEKIKKNKKMKRKK